MLSTMSQLKFPFLGDVQSSGYTSEAERAFTLRLPVNGWLPSKPANDNGEEPVTWSHRGFPHVIACSQVDLFYINGIEHRADYLFQYYGRPSRAVVVEIDGDRWHDSPGRMRRDKHVDRLVQGEVGWRILRYPAVNVLDPRTCDAAIREINRSVAALYPVRHAQPHSQRTA
jgi:hypothetical protein